MQVIKLFEKLLRFKSITPNDDGGLDFIEEYLEDFDSIKIYTDEAKAIFLYKKFSDGKHLCFSGHIDVVPPGNGWETPPFEPTTKDGYIYARGAQDMKSGLASFIQAIKELKDFNGTLSIMITSDEEEDGIGTQNMLSELKKRDFLPDYAVVAEPTCEETFGDAIKVGRRGSINGILEKVGKQGHAAYPEKTKNPIHKVAQVLPKIAGINLDEGDEYFSPSKFVITDIRAGMEVTNVTPDKLKMMFNIRNSTKTSKKDVENFIEKYFWDMDYSLVLNQTAKPFVTNKNSKIVKQMQQSIQNIVHIDTKLSTAGGTSDARFFGEYGIDTVEFGVINDTIHKVNERTSIKEVENLYKVFKDLLERF